jgi:DNA repair protein RadA/Sms
MAGTGLQPVADPARAFLGANALEAPGVVVGAVIEGSRPLLVEVQALVAPASLGPPRRTLAGIDSSRMALIIAVLARRAGVDVSGRDVYAVIAGGLDVTEPAVDLAVAIAVASSQRDVAVPNGTVAFGEISLLGEVRPVRAPDRRLREAARLGYRRVIVPASRSDNGPDHAGTSAASGLEVRAVRTLREALDVGLAGVTGTSG